MGSTRMVRSATALAVAALFAGCSTWNSMDRQDKGAALGATTGAVVGAAVGGPVGAAVGAGAGGYVGHEGTPSGSASMVSGGSRTANDGSRSAAESTQSASPAGRATDSAAAPRTQDYGTSATATSRAYGTGPDAARTAGMSDERVAANTAGASGSATSGASATQARANDTARMGQGASADAHRAMRDRSQQHMREHAAHANSRMSGARDGMGRGAPASAAEHDSETVRSVQQTLSQRGFDPGPIDGIWGPRTEAALRRFQQAQGMAASGDLDPQTLAALNVPSATSATSGTSPAGSTTTSPSATGSSDAGRNASGTQDSGTQGQGAGSGATTGTSR